MGKSQWRTSGGLPDPKVTTIRSPGSLTIVSTVATAKDTRSGDGAVTPKRFRTGFKKILNKTIKQTNKDIKEFLTEDKFEKRVRKLLKLGLVELVGAEEDGSPIVKVTEWGLRLALEELESENN